MKKIISMLLTAVLVCSLCACVGTATEENSGSADTEALAGYENAHVLKLSETTATLDGAEVEEFDYTWHISPDEEGEWYEGTEPSTGAAAYVAHDLWYYPELDESGFTQQQYDDETEWCYYYTADGLTDYVFSTLPVLGNELPTEMMHSEEEAYENKVIHITQAGTYILEGTWHGQIFVDLGDKDETFTDENAKVTFVLNGVSVTCDAAPAVIFYSAYECDNTWEDAETHTNEVDTANAGVNVIVADGTENNFTGANVYRLLKAKYKSDDSKVQKKAHKTDGAFYSFVSMNINGESAGTGILNITSTTFEGLDTELHLTINGGYINIYSQDDGINVNEDEVSVFTLNDGTLHIFAGQGAEGDVVDSNGYIVINGGLIAGGSPSVSDDILDSDCGSTINGGEVIEMTTNQGAGGGMMPGGNMGEKPDDNFDPNASGNAQADGQTPPELPDGAGGQMQGGQMQDGQAPGNAGQMQPPTGESAPAADGTTTTQASNAA